MNSSSNRCDGLWWASLQTGSAYGPPPKKSTRSSTRTHHARLGLCTGEIVIAVGEAVDVILTKIAKAAKALLYGNRFLGFQVLLLGSPVALSEKGTVSLLFSFQREPPKQQGQKGPTSAPGFQPQQETLKPKP